MKRFTALILMVGVLLLALVPMSASASTVSPDFLAGLQYARNGSVGPWNLTLPQVIMLDTNNTNRSLNSPKWTAPNLKKVSAVKLKGTWTNGPYGTDPTSYQRKARIVINRPSTFVIIEISEADWLAGTVIPVEPPILDATQIYATPSAGFVGVQTTNIMVDTIEAYADLTPEVVWASMKVVSVTANSVTLSWDNVGSGDYSIRLSDPTGSDPANDQRVISVPRQSGTTTTTTITGLKGNVQYGAYVKLLGGQETGRNFTTDSSEFVVKALMSGEQLMANASTKVSAYGDLEVKITDWTRFDLYINDQLIKAVTSPQASNIIQLSEFQSKIDANLGAKIEIRTYKNGETTVSKIFSFHASSFDFAVGDTPSGNMPHTPTKPDNNWDLVGWFKYGIDWIIYLVESVVWLLASMGGLIQTVWTSSSGFIAMLGGIFSFMPKEVTALMVLGMGLAVILRVFGR